MIIHKDLIQGSPEWLKARLGKVSASNSARIGEYKEAQYYADSTVNQKKGIAGCLKYSGGWSDGAKTYSLELVAETILQIPTFVPVNFAMEFGTANEPYAREIYETSRGITVEEVGGIEKDGIWYSPDGLVGVDGLIEIKCPQAVQHLKNLLSNTVEEKYIRQLQFGLMVTGRKWVDFISFNPNFPDHLASKVIRVYPDFEYQANMMKNINLFKQYLIELKYKLN